MPFPSQRFEQDKEPALLDVSRIAARSVKDLLAKEPFRNNGYVMFFYKSTVAAILNPVHLLLSCVQGETAPHWTAHTIGCKNNMITTQTITLTLNTKGNIVSDDHLN